MGQIKKLQAQVHKTAQEKGWYDQPRNAGELIALMHSELSEALEALRGKLVFCDDEDNNVGEELADTVIRIMDACEYWNLDLEKEILKKMDKNKKRPHRHGKKF